MYNDDIGFSDNDSGCCFTYRAAKQYSNVFWTTRIGSVVCITDMKDDHIKNILNYLNKRLEEWRRAQEAASIRSNVDLGPLIINDRSADQWFDLFVNELSRRQKRV